MVIVSVFATLAPGLSRELMIFREAALFGRHTLPALASGLGSALGIIREIPAAGLAALAGNVPLLFSSIEAKPRFEVWDWSRPAIIIPRNCGVFITDFRLNTGDFITKQSIMYVVPSIPSKYRIGTKVTSLYKIVSDALRAEHALLSYLFDLCSLFVAIPVFYGSGAPRFPMTEARGSEKNREIIN
jgi:hypothetical protein